jgi:uncharacterized protein
VALLEKYLMIKRSGIPNAGMGLFTTIPISRGECIVEYKGRRELWRNVKHQDGYNGYLLRLNQSVAINALPYKRALGRFANDAKGIFRKGTLTNNAEYLIEGGRCYIYATRNIKPGAEILVSYGREYWDLIRKIIRQSPTRNGRVLSK